MSRTKRSRHDDTGVVRDLLEDYDENLAEVAKLSDDKVNDIHIPLLSHLCGDLSLTSLWKMVYLCGFQQNMQDCTTMLSLVTEYIVYNATAMYERHPQATRHLLQKLACIWNSTIMKAKLGLSDKSFKGMVHTLERCVQYLILCNQHEGLDDVLSVAHCLQKTDRSQIHHAAPNKCQCIDHQFPCHAFIPFIKIQKILGAGPTSMKPTDCLEIPAVSKSLGSEDSYQIKMKQPKSLSVVKNYPSEAESVSIILPTKSKCKPVFDDFQFRVKPLNRDTSYKANAREASVSDVNVNNNDVGVKHRLKIRTIDTYFQKNTKKKLSHDYSCLTMLPDPLVKKKPSEHMDGAIKDSCVSSQKLVNTARFPLVPVKQRMT